MIVVMQPEATEADIEGVTEALTRHGLLPSVSRGAECAVIGAIVRAIPEPHTFNSPGAEGDHRLVSLHAFIELGFFQVQPGINPFRAHGIFPEEKTQRDRSQTNRRQKISPPDTSEEEHDSADGAQQQRGAHVRF